MDKSYSKLLHAAPLNLSIYVTEKGFRVLRISSNPERCYIGKVAQFDSIVSAAQQYFVNLIF